MLDERYLRSAAILLWLEPDQSALGLDFDPALAEAPPSPNPEAWWLCVDAIIYSMEVVRGHTKMPWIKVGEAVLTPDEIEAVYAALRRSRAGAPTAS